jgi:hypothetical protein
VAKVSRELLKGLVKECLVEILAEGLAGNGTVINESKVSPMTSQKPRKNQRKSQSRRAALDLISMGGSQEETRQPSAALEQRIKSVSAGNTIMESIFRDTAQNTLPNMVAADGKATSRGMAQRMTQGDAATKAMAATDPMDVFEGASNWATLAFAGSTNQS